MDKKKRRNKNWKFNANRNAAAATKVSTFDTADLPKHLGGWFRDADDLIQSQFTMLTKHEEFLRASKDQAMHNIDFCFEKIVQIANRRKQLLKGEINDIYSNQLEEYLERKESVLLSGMFLETLLKQSKEMCSIREGENVRGFEDMVHREIDRHCSMASNSLPDKTLIEFDRTLDILEPVERKIRMIGKVRRDHSLPVSVTITDCDVVVGLQSHIELQILNGFGDPLPPCLVKSGLMSIQLKDEHSDPVHYRLDSNEQDNTVCVQFTPATVDKYTLSVLFSVHLLKEIEIVVNENTPSLAFGPTEGLMQPNALCALSDGRVCIADSGASKLLLFSNSGSLVAEESFPEGGFVPFDVTCPPNGTYLLCSGSSYDDQDDTLSASPDDNIPGFPLEMDDCGGINSSPELPNDEEEPSSDNKNNDDETCMLAETEDLKINEAMLDTVRVRYIEKRGYVTLTSQNQIILGEVKTNTIQVYDTDGQFLRIIASPTLDCLGAVQYKPEGQVIVSDIGNCRLLKGTPDTGLCERWGSVETESKQLLLPLGLALDDVGNLLVADGGGPKVFIYGEWGEYVGRLELGPPEIDSEAGNDKVEGGSPCSLGGTPRGVEVSVIPWALTVVGTSIWVIDNNSHKVLRYTYNTP